MSERRIQELLKEKQVYDSYRKERAKRGDREMKSTSNIKDDAQKNVLKESIIKNKLDTTIYEEPKPEPELGEIIYDYYARLEEWTERANKIEEMKNLAINQELIKERDRLRKNFERIMTPGEAQQMMIKVDDGNIIKLNKYWAGFEKKLRDQFSNIDFDTLEEFIYKYIDIVENGGDQLSMLKNISQDVKSMKTDYESISNSIGTLQEGFKDAKVEIKDVIKQAVKTGNKKLIKAVESVNTNVNDSYNKLSQLAKNRDSMTEEQMTRELSKLTETVMKSSANIEKMISDSSEMANSNQASIYENLITIVNELAMGFENINEKLDDNQDEITAAINQSVDTYAEIINHIQSNQTDESEYQQKLNEKLDSVIEAFTPSKSKIPTEFDYVPFNYVPFDYVPTKDTSNEIEMLDQLEQVLRPTVDKTETTYSTPNIKLKLYKNDDIKDTELTKTGKASIRNKLTNPSLTEDQNGYLMDAEKILGKPGIYNELYEKIHLGKALSSDDYNKKVIPLVRELRNGYIKENSEDKNAYVDARKFSKSIIGMGIKDTSKIKPPETKVDDLKLLGRYYIDTNKLSNNQLRLFHQSGNHVKYFKQQVISDDLVNLINFILEKKKYNEKLFNLLEDEEKTLFKNIFMKSGLGKMLNVYIYDHTNKDAKKKYEDLKERVAILQGEIDAGNDNKQIVKDLNETIKELKQQIVYMSQLGLINLKTAQMMILSL